MKNHRFQTQRCENKDKGRAFLRNKVGANSTAIIIVTRNMDNQRASSNRKTIQDTTSSDIPLQEYEAFLLQELF